MVHNTAGLAAGAGVLVQGSTQLGFNLQYTDALGKIQALPIYLGAKTDLELVGLLKHRNEWHARTAQRLLSERAAQASNDEKPLDPKDWSIGFNSTFYVGADAALLRPEGGFTTTNTGATGGSTTGAVGTTTKSAGGNGGIYVFRISAGSGQRIPTAKS